MCEGAGKSPGLGRSAKMRKTRETTDGTGSEGGQTPHSGGATAPAVNDAPNLFRGVPRLIPGDRVQVVTGPFAGVEGKVAIRCDARRLAIALQLQQAGIALEIDESSLVKQR